MSIHITGSISQISLPVSLSIYQIFCECKCSYIGESNFELDKRVSEHKRDIRNGVLTNALTQHCMETNHKIDWSLSKIIGREQDTIRRRLKEALFIQKLSPELNVSKGMILRGKWSI